MKASINLPFQPGVIVTPEAAESIKGQYATVLFGGKSVLGAVVDAAVLGDPGRQTLWVELEADEFPGLASLEIPVPEFPDGDVTQDLNLDWSGVPQERTSVHDYERGSDGPQG